MAKNDYIFLKQDSIYLQVKEHVGEHTYCFRTADEASEERYLDISQVAILKTMPVTVRVMVNDEPSTIQMEMSCSAKVSDVIEELAELTTENKYKLTLVKDGVALKKSDSLAELKVTQLLCMKGGDVGPKTFMRFT